MQSCSKCKKLKPLEAFSLDRSRRNGRGNKCRDCEKSRPRGRGLPSQAPSYRTAQRHSITSERLAALRADGCGVCGGTEGLAVDHDHSCCPGKRSCGACIRGVLCSEHNLALGKLGDNLDGVMRLVRYLTCSPLVKQ